MSGALTSVVIGRNHRRHCEPQGVERRPSFRTGYGEAIQRSWDALRSLDCFAIARRKRGVYDALWLLAMTVPC